MVPNTAAVYLLSWHEICQLCQHKPASGDIHSTWKEFSADTAGHSKGDEQEEENVDVEAVSYCRRGNLHCIHRRKCVHNGTYVHIYRLGFLIHTSYKPMTCLGLESGCGV